MNVVTRTLALLTNGAELEHKDEHVDLGKVLCTGQRDEEHEKEDTAAHHHNELSIRVVFEPRLLNCRAETNRICRARLHRINDRET
jgi:hypothetical protein